MAERYARETEIVNYLATRRLRRTKPIVLAAAPRRIVVSRARHAALVHRTLQGPLPTRTKPSLFQPELPRSPSISSNRSEISPIPSWTLAPISYSGWPLWTHRKHRPGTFDLGFQFKIIGRIPKIERVKKNSRDLWAVDS